MRLEQTPRPDHALRVSARLITSSTILHLSTDEFERTVNQEQTENPALEVEERSICLFCGSYLYNSQSCTTCGRFAQNVVPPRHNDEAPAAFEMADAPWTHYDGDNFGFTDSDEDEYDPLAHIPTVETLAEMLLQQLDELITSEDAAIAEQLVWNLDERGYLECSVLEIAEQLNVPAARVEYVLKQLQTLEPLGIGARNPRECLLIQLHVLSEQKAPHPLASVLIEQYLDKLSHKQFHEIARQLKVRECDVRQANLYIRSSLHPYPAHIYRADTSYARLGSGASYIHPDIVIRQGDAGFEVELIEKKRYKFQVRTQYAGQLEPPDIANRDVQHYMHQHRDRASFFVDCIERRWRTLKRVAELVVDYQQDFLARGRMHPLTRAEVALNLGLDEGTVSRATANKYALLPNGRLMALALFFDGSLGIKDLLLELIQHEDPQHRLSDEHLARLLSAQHVPLARRTVTKYREEMGIGSSRERC